MHHPPYKHVILIDTTSHIYGSRRGAEIALGVWTFRRADWCFTNPVSESIVSQVRHCVSCEYGDLPPVERVQIYKEAMLAYAKIEDIVGYVDNQDVVDCTMRILGGRTVALEICTWKPYDPHQPQPTHCVTYSRTHHAVHDPRVSVQQHRIQFG